ncbi:hypothetical protein TELCIR_16627 [Teladorsagia circumcincta]|uniref:Uncharacterized protein n=1 Tax=Teladorsagia circumcincta TaxID=45464 RepID=A0A2G9TV82_TELCI|nr:hypothetical protein TELCIR_16627 [Teladorsagia circumcincta]
MSKACCLNSQKPCDYHLVCADGDDTYYRMESISKLYAEGQPRMKQASIPVVSTIVVENEDRKLVPALSRRPDNGASQKELEAALFKNRLKDIERSIAASSEKPPLSKRLRRGAEAGLDKKQHRVSSDSQQEDASKVRTRKSARGSKAKVFEDFVALP